MSRNVCAFVWKRLAEWGLNRVYGYPGDGVGGLDVALEKAKDHMAYVQVRHEEMAAFMASAHPKFTGQVGLCYATSGPGAIHCSTDSTTRRRTMSFVAIVGQQARSALGASYQQEVDLQNLFKDVASFLELRVPVPRGPQRRRDGRPQKAAGHQGAGREEDDHTLRRRQLSLRRASVRRASVLPRDIPVWRLSACLPCPSPD